MFRTVYLLYIIIILSFNISAQTDCGKDLKEAFKERYSYTSENDIYNHFSTFFSLEETQLDEMARKYKSEQEIDAAYKAIAVFWSQNIDDQTFRKRFREYKAKREASYTIDNSFYSTYFQETVSKDALEAYIQCVQELPMQGEKLPGNFYYEVNGDLLAGFTFVLNKTSAAGIIDEATVVSVISNNLEFYDSYNLKPNVKVRSYTGLSQNMKLQDPNVPATLTINIENFDPLVVEFPAYPYANFPVGSVMISMLDFNAFSTETKNTLPYNDRESKWAPADGRDVSNSDYGKQYNTVTPDMRGQFVRGRNQFFNSQEPVTFLNGQGTAPRLDVNQYSYQSDHTKAPTTAFTGSTTSPGTHAHTFKDQGTRYNSEEDGGGRRGTRYENQVTKKTNTDGGHSHTVSVDGGGDRETTPKNIAVYYYIRINK